MKTLIFNGSPRKGGDTASLLAVLYKELHGDIMTVNAYGAAIRPCNDCRACWHTPGCVIKDAMTAVYEYILDCDNVVIASPVYFSELTGPLLSVMSRLQAFYGAGHFLNLPPAIRPKRGGIILVGGGDGAPDKAKETACGLLRQMNVRQIGPLVGSFYTNEIPAKADAAAMADADALAVWLSAGSPDHSKSTMPSDKRV